MGLVAGEQREIKHSIAILVEDCFPNLVRAAPGANDQEIKIVPTTVQHDKAKPSDFERSLQKIGSGQLCYFIRNRPILGMHCMPLQHRSRCLEHFTRRDLFGCMPVLRVDPYVSRQNSCEGCGWFNHRLSATRRNARKQLPPTAVFASLTATSILRDG